MSNEERFSVISDGLPSQLPDVDPDETNEWLQSLDAVIESAGRPRARFLMLKMLERGQLTEGHARAVLAVPDHEGRRALARKIVQKGMSVRAAERAARWAGAKTKQRRQQAKLDPALVARAKKAADRITGFSSRVVSNRLEISFAYETELEELVEALERTAPGS